MKLISLKQFEKKSRGSLMRFINGYLKTQSKKQIDSSEIKITTIKNNKTKSIACHTRRV